MSTSNLVLEKVEQEVISGNLDKALELLDQCVGLEGVSAAGLNCRLARAMGYGNGLFKSENGNERCVEDYRFVRAHGGNLVGDAPKVYVEAMWSLGPSKHYDELLSVLKDWGENSGDSRVADFRLAVLYEFYGNDYGRAQFYYRKVFKKKIWPAGKSWARCLVKGGKPLRGVLVHLISMLCKPFFDDHVVWSEKGQRIQGAEEKGPE